MEAINMVTCNVLSIEAWGNSDDGWDWNNWFKIGEITLNINGTERETLKAMETAGFIVNSDGGLIDDDGYNLVVKDKHTDEPVFAIEYGSLT